MYRIGALGVQLLAAVWIWNSIGQPAAAILVGLFVLVVVAWHVALVFAVAVVPYSISLCWPRTARAWWRQRDERNRQASSRTPAFVRAVIWSADRDRCVNCHQPGRHIDHRVPWSFGGMSLLPNLFLLCASCNLVKLTFWVDRHGVEHGRTSDRDLARQIWSAERRARRSLARWCRIAWAFV